MIWWYHITSNSLPLDQEVIISRSTIMTATSSLVRDVHGMMGSLTVSELSEYVSDVKRYG